MRKDCDEEDIMKRIGEHAIVIGASMGGLLAARTLSEFFATVTLLERDVFPISDVPRKRVPQGRHAHGLLARGRNVIEDFFPGWTDEVVASGGVRGDICGDVSWIGHGVMLHGCRIESHCLIGMRATLMNDAVVGEYSIIGAGAVVTERTVIPPRSLVLGLPARVKRPLTDQEVAGIDEYARRYYEYKETYLAMKAQAQ